MMKKLLALVLCLMMMFSLVPVTAEGGEPAVFTLEGYREGAAINKAKLTMAPTTGIMDGVNFMYGIYDITAYDHYEMLEGGTFRKDRAYGVAIRFPAAEPREAKGMDAVSKGLPGMMDLPEDVMGQVRELIQLTNPHLSLRAMVSDGDLFCFFDLEPLEGYPSTLQLTMKGYELGAPVNGVKVTAKQNPNGALDGMKLLEYAIGEKVGDTIDITQGKFKANTTYYLAVLVGGNDGEPRSLDKALNKALEDVPEWVRGWALRDVDLTNEYVSKKVPLAYEDMSFVIWFELKPLEAPVPVTGDATNTMLLAALLTLSGAALLLLRKRAHN
ncbi:MAG: LPXTG cell wall anchor domain-containing protein [Clostridia bacterium]|nr:LPXTG cell wall anchor domain-containing protein [Clostridia bacterium]